MTRTPEEHGPGTAVGGVGEEDAVDGSVILANFPVELLVILAETLGNPLALLVSKAHLNKAFRAAACALLKRPSRRSTWVSAATSPTRRWWRLPRGASSSRRST